jgi:holo-[acyl-carrier protein] synthase
MIVGLGIDSVEIDRFRHWRTYSPVRLKKLFSEAEIVHCTAISLKSAERFAARFAVREAFFKALGTVSQKQLPFFRVCRAVSMNQKGQDYGRISVDWATLGVANEGFECQVSITHTRSIATAVVIIQKGVIEKGILGKEIL